MLINWWPHLQYWQIKPLKSQSNLNRGILKMFWLWCLKLGTCYKLNKYTISQRLVFAQGVRMSLFPYYLCMYFKRFKCFLFYSSLTGSDNADVLTGADLEVTTERFSIWNTVLSDITPFFELPDVCILGCLLLSACRLNWQVLSPVWSWKLLWIYGI